MHNYAYSLITHPDFQNQTPQDQQLAQDTFRSYWQNLGSYVDAQELNLEFVNLYSTYNLDAVDAIVDNITDSQQLFISPFEWSNAIQSIADAPLFDPTIAQADADAQIREIMADLADNPIIDISYIVDIPALGFTLQNAGFNGNLGTIDAITDNLSDDAQLAISPNIWSTVIQSIADAPLFDPTIAQADADAQIREIMADLADNPIIDISYIVDIPALGFTLQNLAMQDSFGTIDAIVDNLSDQALTFVDTVALKAQGVDVGTNGNESLWDTSGTYDAIYGLGGNDTVVGGGNDTSLYGGDGTDYVYDWIGGNDVISGGDGADFLYGGSGADSFVFYEGETGVDTIWAFNSVEGDRLDIRDYLDQFDPLQDAINDFVILTENGNSTTVSVDIDGTGAGAAQDIATLSGVTGLNIEDVIDTTSFV